MAERDIRVLMKILAEEQVADYNKALRQSITRGTRRVDRDDMKVSDWSS